MPIYEYECPKCGATFEDFTRIPTTKNIKCKKCGHDMNRIVSKSTFHLKGGGWAEDGYATKT